MEVFSDQKDFIRNFIKRLSPAGSTICNPFMGKGIIGRATLAMGRTYIGIERDTVLFLSTMNMLHEQR
jgi:DNA modification methylase